jgi:hypothetical protein
MRFTLSEVPGKVKRPAAAAGEVMEMLHRRTTDAACELREKK